MKTILLSFHSFRSDERALSSAILPVRVIDASGTLICWGKADARNESLLSISSDSDLPIFVQLILPSGQTIAQRAIFNSDNRAAVHFSHAAFIEETWDGWARARIPAPTRRKRALRTNNVAPYKGSWMRLWKCAEGKWNPLPVEPVDRWRGESSCQIDLELNKFMHLLQIGGPRLPPRFISLPSGGLCRIFLTPKQSLLLNEFDPLDIVITGFRPETEQLLAFLSRNALDEASLFQNSPATHDPKLVDPITAIAMAYLMLSNNAWKKVERSWFVNVLDSAFWIPDAALILSVVQFRHGLSSKDDLNSIFELIQTAFMLGIPLFSAARSLLVELMPLLHVNETSQTRHLIGFVEHLLAASAPSKQIPFSFYGTTPDWPRSLESMLRPAINYGGLIQERLRIATDEPKSLGNLVRFPQLPIAMATLSQNHPAVSLLGKPEYARWTPKRSEVLFINDI